MLPNRVNRVEHQRRGMMPPAAISNAQRRGVGGGSLACLQGHIGTRGNNCPRYWATGAGKRVRIRSEGWEQVGGGRRGDVREFSEGSRRRLRMKLQAIEWPCEFQHSIFVTLTYPGEMDSPFMPDDGRTVKRHLKALALRYKRRFGVPMRCVWKLEYQKREAPHLHLALVPHEPMAAECLPDEFIESQRRWFAQAWWEIVGSGCEKHRKAGTSLEFFKSSDPSGYFASYVGDDRKEYQHQVPDWFSHVGRWWGVLGGLKVMEGSAELSQDQAVRFVRTVKRYKWARSRTVAREVWERKPVDPRPRYRKAGKPKGRRELREKRKRVQREKEESAYWRIVDPRRSKWVDEERRQRQRQFKGVTVCGGGFPKDLIYQLARVLGEEFAKGLTRLICRQSDDGQRRFREGMFIMRGQFETEWVT